MSRPVFSHMPHPLEKEASTASKLRTLLTGRTSLYHGTSPMRGAQIRQTGLKPDVKGGISEAVGMDRANQGLTFTNRTGTNNAGKNDALNYAAQQRFLDEGVPFADVAKKVENAEFLPKNVRDLAAEYPKAVNARVPATMINKLRPSTREGLLEARLPLSDVANRAVRNPEIDVMAGQIGKNDPFNPIIDKIPEPVANLLGGRDKLNKDTIEYFAQAPFKNNVVLQGGIEPQHFGGRPFMEKLKETGDHWKNLVTNPVGTLKNVIRYG